MPTQYAVALERRDSMYARVNAELQPQAARAWHEHPDAVHTTVSERRRSTFRGTPKSKGRGGRKIGQAAHKHRREEDWLKRGGALSRYELVLVRRDPALDPMLTQSAACSERRLWNELHTVHLGLRNAHIPAGPTSINHAYFDLIDTRLMRAELDALAVAQTRGISERKRDKLLHVHRRQMAILHTEQELLTMTSAQSRAIGCDGSFIACGRRVKQREFKLTFGWWSSEQLLDKHGIEVSDDASTTSYESSDGEASKVASEADRGSEAVMRDLFASDVEDDSDVEDYFYVDND